MFEYVDDLFKNDYLKEKNAEYYSNKNCKVQKVQNGIVLPLKKFKNDITSKGRGGVLDKNLRYIESSAMLAKNMVDRVKGKYKIDLKKLHYIDEEVVYANAFYEHWGHFLIDIVSRLWYVIKNPNEYKIVFAVEMLSNTKINGNYLEFLELLGIDKDRIIIINEPTMFKSVIVPDVSIYPGNYYTKQYKNIFDYIFTKINYDSSAPKKIYLSRTKFKKARSKEKGEKSIEKLFNKNGYKVIYPETMTLKEQIFYYKNCEQMVCINGTLSHNILFSKDGINIIIINKTYKMNKIQGLVNQVKKASYIYIDCHISLFPIAYGKGPFIIIKGSNLKRYVKDYRLKWTKDYFLNLKKFYYKLWYLKEYKKQYDKGLYIDKNCKDNSNIEQIC